MYKYAIFDLDGTLVDSMPMWCRLPTEYLQRKGAQPRPDLLEQIAVRTLPESVLYIKEAYALSEPPEQIAGELGEMAFEQYRTSVLAKPHVAQALEQLRRAGVVMCVASASEYEQIRAVLERLGLLDYFAFLHTCTLAGAGKHKPDIFLQSLARMGGTDPAEAVVFEDSLYSAQTAKAAGFAVAGVADAFSAANAPRLKSLCDFWCEDASRWPEIFR